MTFLKIADLFFTIFHLVLTLFNMFGWIFRRTRKLHLIIISATTFSWLVLGIWYGLGYCPFTDWQWKIKHQLGEKDLPNSFITYFLNSVLHAGVSDDSVYVATEVVFILVVLCTIYVNFIRNKTVFIRTNS